MNAPTELLRVDRLRASVGGSAVLHEISLTLAAGELLALLGPNGSGKTTLLRCLAGLDRPTAGTIVLDGEDVTRRAAHRRRIGLLVQEPALLPGRSVLENVAYGPLVQRRSSGEARASALDALREVRLEHLAGRSATALSGGERQRVALARAIAARPKVVLLDEPFAAIDPEVRGELRGDFRRVLRSAGIAAIHVTHDREEGLFLGDRVAILLEGRLRALGTPREVHDAPRSARVARFLGYNVLTLDEGQFAVDPGDVHLDAAAGAPITARFLASGAIGREEVGILRTGPGERVEVRAPLGNRWPSPGTEVGVRWERSIPLLEE